MHTGEPRHADHETRGYLHLYHSHPFPARYQHHLLPAGHGELRVRTEAQEAQVHCNSADSGGCNDWFIDPVPVVNPDGSTSPGQTRARLNLVHTIGNTGYTDEGDFYLTFHIHVTRP